ncbi:hypothetical protein FXO37_05924 [Capsicum annuum]|nr:hypothetical protein FXO37_05924 [Capsicum annuum]
MAGQRRRGRPRKQIMSMVENARGNKAAGSQMKELREQANTTSSEITGTRAQSVHSRTTQRSLVWSPEEISGELRIDNNNSLKQSTMNIAEHSEIALGKRPVKSQESVKDQLLVHGDEKVIQTPTEKKEGNQWGNLFAGNRVASNGMSLKYVTPKRVNGEMPGFNFMKRYIAQQWSAVAKPELYYHDEGYYIVKFQFEPDMKEGCDSLSRIASAIGIPLFADECRTKTTRIFYARMLIEVEVTKVIPNEIKNNGCKGEYISTTYPFRLEAKNTVIDVNSISEIDGVKTSTPTEKGAAGNTGEENFTPVKTKSDQLVSEKIYAQTLSIDTRNGFAVLQSLNVVVADKPPLDKEGAQTTKPWLIWGDFNALLKSQDRVHGAPVTKAEIQDFATCMHDLSLNKLAWKGGQLVEPEAIQREILTFYQALMGTSLLNITAVNLATMKNGPPLTHQQKVELCVDVTDQEIYTGLCSIGDDKAPGVDGYNTKFFKKNVANDQLGVKAYSRKYVSPRCMIKVDIQKAYDTMDWHYLNQAMDGLGFPQNFTNWVMQCVTTSSYSLLINGELTKPFEATRGLRQGDPMSPFLFAIVIKYLSRSLKELEQQRDFNYHPLCKKLHLTHLSFADDLLLFARGDTNSVKLLHEKFITFTEASGLQVNHAKSVVYFGGVTDEVKVQIQQNLGFSYDSLPFKYLGVPLSTKKLSILQWQPLINQIVNKISS